MNSKKQGLQAEAARIRDKYPGRITVFVERAEKTDISDIVEKNESMKIEQLRALQPKARCVESLRLIVPGDITVGQFVHIVCKKNRLSADKAIFVFVKNILPSTAALMSAIYEEHKAEDGILYMTFSGENAFGSSLNGS
ncbi:hypothetical protein AgCh_014289 [Apium graveolens]